MTEELDFTGETKYAVVGYGGIAFYLLGYEEIRDENYGWTGIPVVNKDMVRAVMVGDDRIHLIDVDDLEAIDPDSYCPECGQIGCKAYG